MVHGLAEQSNGSMSIQSTPGHGTAGSLLLPVAVAHAQGATTTGLAKPRAPRRMRMRRTACGQAGKSASKRAWSQRPKARIAGELSLAPGPYT